MQNEWISIKDRLPKLATPVIVATACGNVFEAARIRKNRKHYWTNAVWEYEPMEIKTGKVTYWQPLPEPPKGE